MLDVLAWYLAVQVTALAAWPLLARALEPLDDRGWGLSKVAGILLVGWITWLLGMLLGVPFTRLTLALVTVSVGVLAWWGLRRRSLSFDAVEWVRRRRVLVLAWEWTLLLSLAFFALLRAHEPGILGTEKPMDMAFLNGFVAAERLPTQDTWLAGFPVPYYYFGYFLFASLTKLSGVAAAVGYNLAAATVPALATVGLASLAWNVARAATLRPVWSGAAAALAAVFVMLAGNLSAALEFLVSRDLLNASAGPVIGVKNFAQGVVSGVWPPDGAWWWRASRVVPNTQPDGINEFPFFSILLSDLHPHFMALPFEALILGLITTHLVSRGRALLSPWTQALAALALGTLLVLNTWDVAPFWLLYGVAAWIAGRDLPTRKRLLAVVTGPLGGIVLYLPYFVGYSGPPLSPGIVTDRTPFGSLLVLFGVQIALLAVYGLWRRWRLADRRGWVVAGAGAAMGGMLTLVGEPTLGLLVALVALLLPWPRLLPRLSGAEMLVHGVAFFAACMLLGVELIFLRDTFGTRMNTVFKFHYNVWLLAGLTGALGAVLVIARERSAVRWLTGLVIALALASGLVYPLSATQTRLAHTPPGGRSLNGETFLTGDEAAAVRWLREQTSNARPVIAEAVGGAYTQAARMATYSGGAAVLGWAGHELQWRGPLTELSQRESALRQLYRDGDPATIRSVLDRYGVDYVVVGELERQQYGPQVDSRFEGLLPVAYRAGRVTIYRAPGAATLAGR